MSLIDRLERRFGAWTIPQFPLFIVLANGLIYLLAQVNSDFLLRLMLDPQAIRQGEVWRILTFLFIPPMMGMFWMLFWLLLLYQFTQALEQEWGEFRFLVFYGVGALSMIIAALWIVGETLSNVPLNTTLFLAFATMYPNYELLLFFILPVKVKYLAILTWLGLIGAFVMGSTATRVAISASLINYFLFFGSQIWTALTLKWNVFQARRRFRDSNDD